MPPSPPPRAGGLSGAAAMGINVGTLMWLRTTINYQVKKMEVVGDSGGSW